MSLRRIIGLVIAALGVVLLFTSNYISDRVLEGQAQIGSAQRKVDTADSLFSLNPATKQLGKGVTGSAQSQIDAGQQEVNRYQTLAGQIKIGGFALIGVGAFLFFMPRRKKS